VADRLSYGMSPAISGIGPVKTDPSATVGFYDGVGSVVFERHGEGANYAFMDGSAKWYDEPPEGFAPAQVIER